TAQSPAHGREPTTTGRATASGSWSSRRDTRTEQEEERDRDVPHGATFSIRYASTTYVRSCVCARRAAKCVVRIHARVASEPRCRGPEALAHRCDLSAVSPAGDARPILGALEQTGRALATA